MDESDIEVELLAMLLQGKRVRNTSSPLKNTSTKHITGVEGTGPTGERAGPAGRGIGGATAPES